MELLLEKLLESSDLRVSLDFCCISITLAMLGAWSLEVGGATGDRIGQFGTVS